MKKLFIAFIFIASSLCLVGCGKSNLSIIKDNMSEITTHYFYGENDKFSISISVGKRENPYLVDGLHHDVVDFSLITFKDKTKLIKDKEFSCNLVVNNDNNSIKLVYNPIANAFMFDLGFGLDKKDKLVFEYQGDTLDVVIISNDFGISYDKAIAVAGDKFENIISSSKKAGLGEFYLKVLGDVNNSKELFWCFTFVSHDSKSYNIILSVKDGSIMASDV